MLNRSKDFERRIMREMKNGRRNCLIDVSSYLVTLALVHELNKDYDGALYWLGFRSNEDQFQFTTARIEYKRGGLSSAFKRYCDLPESFLNQGTVEDRIQWVKGTVMMADGNLSRFSPFANYSDFLACLDEERQKVENGSDYDKVVSWYHSFDVSLPVEGTQTEEETL